MQMRCDRLKKQQILRKYISDTEVIDEKYRWSTNTDG